MRTSPLREDIRRELEFRGWKLDQPARDLGCDASDYADEDDDLAPLATRLENHQAEHPDDPDLAALLTTWHACQTNRGAPKLALPVDGTIPLKHAN